MCMLLCLNGKVKRIRRGGTSAHPENVLADFPAMETPDWVSGAWRSL
jgi:hypothetical protein